MTNGPRCLDILYVGTLPPYPGGAAISCSQLLLGLAKEGHRVRALAPTTPEMRPSAALFADRHPEIDATRFEIPYFETSPEIPSSEEFVRLEGSEVRRGLVKLLAQTRPDVILVGRESFARYVPELAQAQSLPCVLMTRGNPTLSILRGQYPHPYAQQMLAEYRKADLIITPSRYMSNGLRRLGFANVRSIPNAIDLDQFVPQVKNRALSREVNIQEDDIAVMHVSKLTPHKRPLDLVRSSEEALKQEPRLLYVIVGDGPLRGHLEHTCRRLRVWDRFRFVGWVDYGRMPDYITIADLVVAPSADEGMSRVYLETQACGRVLLASDIPSAMEVIQDGETGLLFRTGDIRDLTGKTLLAAADPGLRNQIGARARRRVEAHSLDSAVARYAKALRAVVHRHQA